MGEDLLVLAVRGSLTPLVVSSMTRCVGGSLGTREAPQIHSVVHVSIDSYYPEGVSVTHGSPRQHIWSFVAGLYERSDTYERIYACPCVAGTANGNGIPTFVGQNYFCETGVTNQYINGYFYSYGDPLWDGQECGPTSSCCTFNSPPWFNVHLSSPTTDDIEVRICGSEGIGNEDSPIQLIELYVK